jgi:hypothetical protein
VRIGIRLISRWFCVAKPSLVKECTVFFVWQSDAPLDDNKHLIRDSANEAVKQVSTDAVLEEDRRKSNSD